jgi:hypothetical protein
LTVASVSIELVDAGLVAAREGLVSSPSPGIAMLDSAGVTTGREAAAQARLKPVFAFDRFWSDLTVDPLPRQVPEAGSRADLAYLQLSRFWEDEAEPGDAVVFAVPGTMRPTELGLLAGIARAARIPVAGYVDLAVAACASLDACETVLHLDLQLHQAVLTELRGTETLRRCRVESAPRVGLRAVHAAWAQLVSEAMVRRTRFDPLHQASTEQQLYERLPAWLSQLAVSDLVDVELEADAGKFAVSLRREQFVFAVEAYYAQLADLIHSARRAGEPVTIALSSRAASLPQLAERCLGLGEAQVVGLAEGAAALGGLAHSASLAADEGEALVTALPRTAAPRRPASTQRGATGQRPTHVTFAGRAHAISGEPLNLGLAPAEGRSLVLAGSAAGVSRSHCTLVQENGVVRVHDHSRYGTFVNGVRVSGSAELAAGDRLRIGTPGVVLELVAVG